MAYADDGYIKAKLSVALQVPSDIKQVLKDDAGLDLNDKTKILVKGISAAEAHAAAQRQLTADPSLAHLGPLLSPKSFVVDGYIGLGVPIGTDAFIQHFVKDKCQEIMEDVDKLELDHIQDCFIDQLISFCEATRLQYLNGQVQPANQQVLQHQHVDDKITSSTLALAPSRRNGAKNHHDSMCIQSRTRLRERDMGPGRPICSCARMLGVSRNSWPQFKALRQRYRDSGTHFEEQRQLHMLHIPQELEAQA